VEVRVEEQKDAKQRRRAQQEEFLSSGKLRFILPCHFEMIALRQRKALPQAALDFLRDAGDIAT